ncbi:MAG: glycosidase [Fibrobacteria bacterium]|nr:glycosidase [Fibrobacteria bacterium]
MRIRRDIVHRWEGNPFLSLESLHESSNNMYTATVTKLDDEYILLATIENLEGKTAIYRAVGSDGYHFTMDPAPVLFPYAFDCYAKYEEMGVSAPRITAMDNKFYIIYLSRGLHGNVLSLAESEDLIKFKKLGPISEPDTTDGALFPSKINGKYARLESPLPGGRLWLSYSHDLKSWGESNVVISPRSGFWDSHRVGCGTTPILIKQGWLIFYFGIKQTSGGPITRMGTLILDKKYPEKVVTRSNVPILSPREKYERIGDHNNYVFSSGAILNKSGEIIMYYGAADNCLCIGTAHIDEILNSCYEGEKDF